MTHKIVQLAPVGSQWKTLRSGTFFGNRVITIVSHDMDERRIQYVYDGDTQRMSKSFDTFEREHKQGNICIIDAAPKAVPCRFQAGQYWESVRSVCPLKLGVRFGITRVESSKVYYKYNDDPVENFRSFSEMARYCDAQWIIPAPVPPKESKPKSQFANPFATAEESLVATDYKSIEQRVMASSMSTANLPVRVQNALHEFMGWRINQDTLRHIHDHIKMILPVGIGCNVSADAQGQGIHVTLEGVNEIYEITPYHIHMRHVPKGSSSQKKVLEEQLKAKLRAAEHRVANLALHIGDHKIEGLEGTMIVRDGVETEPQITLKTTMEKPMTRIVNVFLMDKTAGLKANERMIGKVENFASDSNDNTLLLLELSMEHDLKGMLHDHNKRRKAIINQDILNRVGKTVYLQPIELKDVKIDVQVVTAV